MTPDAPDAQVPGSGGPLLDVLHELDETRRDADSLAGGLSPRQLWWRPGEDDWSVGECLDHLVRAGEAYLEVIDEAVEDAWERRVLGEPPYRRGPVGRWVVHALEPPPGLKLPAPGRIWPRRPETVVRGDQRGPGGPEEIPGGTGEPGPGAPAPAGSPGDTAGTGGGAGREQAESPLPRFMALRGRVAQRLGDAKGLDFGRVKVRSPFVPLLRVDLLSVFHLLAAHERRHLWQARQVTEAEGFPGS